jgi:hypothetical protein
MWRPTMLVLCLIAAMAGTPLRQAEAAGDLARSLAELDDGAVLEEIDGLVGDDAGEAIVSPAKDAGLWQATDVPNSDDWTAFSTAAGRSLSPGQPFGRTVRPTCRTSVASIDPHAWLQRFLF